MELDMVVYIYNSRYSGDRNQEDLGLKQAQVKS
jgi:hypothetical protein